MKPAATAHPHNPWLAHTVRIDRIVKETRGVATYDLIFEEAATTEKYSLRPGQFNMLYLPGLGEIAISISGDPTQSGCVPHTIREAGNVTRSLAGLPVGSTIGLRGPFGACWPVKPLALKPIVKLIKAKRLKSREPDMAASFLAKSKKLPESTDPKKWWPGETLK